MKTNIFAVSIFFIILNAFFGCKTLHLGIGTSYNSGNSGGCDDTSNMGGQLHSDYYFGKSSGPGVGVEFFTPGYTDCNDSDPLLFLIPKIKYRQFLAEKKWALDFGAGYAMGVFVDPGYHLSGGLNFYSGKSFYFRFAQNYYQAFNAKENAIKPGTSSNYSTQLSLGVYF